MKCTIKWNELSPEAWAGSFSKIRRSNVLQSYAYARGLCPHTRQHGRWGLIQIDDRDAGLIQMLEAGIFRGLLHGLTLDRGPLWFEGYGGAAHVKSFFEEFNRQFPLRFRRKRRLIPEINDGPAARKILEQIGLKRLERPGYQTIWIDLTHDLEALRAGLKSNWRGKLNKSERAGLVIEWDMQGKNLDWMIKVYARDRQERLYPGPEPEILKNIVSCFISEKTAAIGQAMLDGQPIASILLLMHGRSATYQAGWSSPEGRETAAHHLLLWEAVKLLKEKGVQDFDLGGINDEGAAGIKTFKEGLGGRSVTLVGHYL